MAGMIFNVSDFGTPKIVGNKLIRTGVSAEQVVPALRDISYDMMRVTKENTDSYGTRGGSSWETLKESTIKKKGITDILHTAGANDKYSSLGNDTLIRSVTVPGASYQLLKINRLGIQFGTNRPHARSHQYGNPKRNIPARPFLAFLPEDEERWKNMITAYLLRGLRETNKVGI